MIRTWVVPASKQQAIITDAVNECLRLIDEGDLDAADRALIHAVHLGVKPIDLVAEFFVLEEGAT